MEKISGILPQSARVASVDMKEAAPVRPGVPTFGRPEGKTVLRGGAGEEFETASRTAPIQRNQLDWRSKDRESAAAVNEVTNNFFRKNTTEVEPRMRPEEERPQLPVRSIMPQSVPSQPAGFKSDGISRSMAARVSNAENDFDAEEPALHQPQGLYPRGSFLDRRI